jgi:hypothetical protein
MGPGDLPGQMRFASVRREASDQCFEYLQGCRCLRKRIRGASGTARRRAIGKPYHGLGGTFTGCVLADLHLPRQSTQLRSCAKRVATTPIVIALRDAGRSRAPLSRAC